MHFIKRRNMHLLADDTSDDETDPLAVLLLTMLNSWTSFLAYKNVCNSVNHPVSDDGLTVEND